MPSPPLSGRRLTPFAPASAPENIDEILLQFEGREDELIETMRTMHDWNVAQRARPNVQKTAKFEARAKASISSASALELEHHLVDVFWGGCGRERGQASSQKRRIRHPNSRAGHSPTSSGTTLLTSL